MDFFRVHKGRTKDPAAFLSLTDCASDRFAFAAPASAFKDDWGLDLTLQRIGFSRDYVEEKLRNGFCFSILEFRSQKYWRADWASVRDLVEEHYGVDCREWESMVSGNFDAYWAEWNEIRQRGKADPMYFDYNHLLTSMGEKANLSALELRRFLFFEFGMRSLFKGDGYAYSEDGAKGVEEYLVPNALRSQVEQLMVSWKWGRP
jgi:hypothetical protein